jgi:hypothetical protein
LLVVCEEVGAHLVVNPIVAALVEKVKVVVGEKLRGGESGFRAHGVAERFAL